MLLLDHGDIRMEKESSVKLHSEATDPLMEELHSKVKPTVRRKANGQ